MAKKKTEPNMSARADEIAPILADEDYEILEPEAELIELPGFEWSKLFDDIHIPAAVLEQALWKADVTEPEHVFTKPNEVNGAFLTVLRQAIGNLKLKVKQMG